MGRCDYDAQRMPLPNPENASVRDPPQGCPAHAFAVWLATPQAVGAFDASRLTDSDRQRLDSIRHPQRRQEFTVSRALLSQVSPAIASRSLSHSHGHAALAQGPCDCAIGVDLERHQPRDALRIARFGFAPEEYAALQELRGPALERAFYAMWVMKEAAAKAFQLPLLDALRRCIFVPGPDGWSGSIPTQRHWSLVVYAPRPDWSLALVAAANVDAADVQTYEWPPRQPAKWPQVVSLSAGPDRLATSGAGVGLLENH